MSAVLDFFRDQEPRFKEVPDDQLTRFIGETHPEFFQDEGFRKEWATVVDPTLGPSKIQAPRTKQPILSSQSTDAVELPPDPKLGELQRQAAEASAQNLKEFQSTGPVPVDIGTFQAEVPKLESSDLITLGVPEPAAKVLAGAQQGVAGALDFFMSPQGVATLGTAALPTAVQRGVAGLFLADMVRQYPDIASNLAQAVRSGDTEGAVKWATTGALNTLFVREGVKHLSGVPQVEASKAIGMALQEKLKDPQIKSYFDELAKDQALELASPESAQLTTDRLPAPERPAGMVTEEDRVAAMAEPEDPAQAEVPPEASAAPEPPVSPAPEEPIPAPVEAAAPNEEVSQNAEEENQKEGVLEPVPIDAEEPEIHGMAAGGPASVNPLRNPQPTTGQVPTAAVPRGATSAAHARTWWQGTRRDVLKVLAPQAIDETARRVGNIVREYNAEAALEVQRADAMWSDWRKSFDKTPVPRNWTYDPNRPLPRNYAFMDDSEKGGATLNPEERTFKDQLDKMFEEMVDDVHAVAPRALQSLVQDYFPHIWKDPKEAQRVFNEVLSKRPLEGSKSFLKQRTKRYVRDGFEAGLVPVSDNPVDIVLQKIHEVRRFIAAQKILQESKAIGARKFVYVFERPPEGWTKVDDRTSTVHAPPFVTVQEAFDAQLRTKTTELLQKLGVPHERLAKLRGKRWGEANEATGEIKSKFAGPDFVIWHELGHVLEFRYKLSKTLADTSQKQAELTALAKLRETPGGSSQAFRKYAQSMDEKMATVLQAYLHAPDLFDKTAPAVAKSFDDFLKAHPELNDLDKIRPSLQLGTAKASYPVGGLVTLGHWYMPEGAAAVLNNYLSPGLGRFGLVRALRTSSNILNGAQLGFSAFHVGFTSLDATVSRAAVALEYLAAGHPLSAAKKFLSTPLAPISNAITGYRVRSEMLRPGTQSPDIGEIAKLAVVGGLRATVDPFWKTEVSRKWVRALHEGGVAGYGKTILHTPFAALEQIMRPILEYLVPWQKLGVFADMARLDMEKLGPNATHEQIREAMARAADSTENRMGQMTYDNLFYNKVVKDMALIGFRAYGWQLGKYREAFGAAFDTAGQLKRPEMTHRMAYALALPMVVGLYGAMTNYLLSGEVPNDLTDCFFPRTGRLDPRGRPQRLMLPSYLKDLISDWRDFPNIRKMGTSFYHKLNPWVSVMVDIMRNKDFYGVRVFNEDDPAVRRAMEIAKFALGAAKPFSVTGAQKLRESGASPTDYLLPFFGVVPAKQALTMTPAEALASDIMEQGMPTGSRTREQFEKSQLLKQLTKAIKEDRNTGVQSVKDAAAAGKITATDIENSIIPKLTLTPMQFQIQSMKAEDAMRVWDLANPKERAEIRTRLILKLSRSKTLDPETLKRFLNVVVKNEQNR